MKRESFVFIQLPGETMPVVCGKFSHEDSIGTGLGKFVYGKSYLGNSNAVPLDPVALPLKESEFTTSLMEGYFGAIRDAIPDDWGKHVAQKLYGKAAETTFDLLSIPAADRFGALSFSENSTKSKPEHRLARADDISSALLASLDKIDRHLALSDAEVRAALLVGGGTHAGGARPKLTIQESDGIWLVKLNRFNDRVNHVRIEAAMLDLACTCEINVPDHEVRNFDDKDALLIRRFDRTVSPDGILKHRAVSAATVFRADEAYARLVFNGSYMRFSREFSRWCTEVKRDRRQLFRRMAFNCLTGITDDHERNHALVAAGAHFRLAPAFDLSPNPPTTRRKLQALPIGIKGADSTRENLVSACDQFDLTHSQAAEIIDDVQAKIATQWQAKFAARAVSQENTAVMAACFNHDFFENG
jgi:serine/threonine-protein kinase HipA